MIFEPLLELFFCCAAGARAERREEGLLRVVSRSRSACAVEARRAQSRAVGAGDAAQAA